MTPLLDFKLTGWQTHIYLEIHLVFISCYPLSHLFVAELVEKRSWHIKEWQNEHLRGLAAQSTLKRGQSHREASHRQEASRAHQTKHQKNTLRLQQKVRRTCNFLSSGSHLLLLQLTEERDGQSDGFIVFFLSSWDWAEIVLAALLVLIKVPSCFSLMDLDEPRGVFNTGCTFWINGECIYTLVIYLDVDKLDMMTRNTIWRVMSSRFAEGNDLTVWCLYKRNSF